jgi:hypothetical protein
MQGLQSSRAGRGARKTVPTMPPLGGGSRSGVRAWNARRHQYLMSRLAWRPPCLVSRLSWRHSALLLFVLLPAVDLGRASLLLGGLVHVPAGLALVGLLGLRERGRRDRTTRPAAIARGATLRCQKLKAESLIRVLLSWKGRERVRHRWQATVYWRSPPGTRKGPWRASENPPWARGESPRGIKPGAEHAPRSNVAISWDPHNGRVKPAPETAHQERARRQPPGVALDLRRRCPAGAAGSWRCSRSSGA